MCATLIEHIEDVFLNSFCFGFRLVSNDYDPLFLSYYFNSVIGRKLMYTLAQGATRYNLSKSNFEDTVVVIPDKEEQTAIALVLSEMENAIIQTEQKLSKTRRIKYGMMQQLLTGKIRLT